MQLKSGVGLTALQPQMIVAVLVIKEIWEEIAQSEPLVITSCNDGTHSYKSRHHIGMAMDFRTKTLGRHLVGEFVNKIKAQLDKDFDIVLEDLNGPNEHLHVEYDPTR